MNCRDCAELVTEYLEGAMEPEDRARMQAHLDACGECEAYLVSVRITVTTLGRLYDAE